MVPSMWAEYDDRQRPRPPGDSPTGGESPVPDHQQREVVTQLVTVEGAHRVQDPTRHLVGREVAVRTERLGDPCGAELLAAAARLQQAVGEQAEELAGRELHLGVVEVRVVEE